MDEITLPKFSWEKTFDHNQGHTKNEWGLKMKRKKRKTIFIEAYTVLGKWANMRTGGLVQSHYD